MEICLSGVFALWAALIGTVKASKDLTFDDLSRSSQPLRTDAAAGALVIDGQPAATIVISDESSQELLFAAKQLQTHLEQMSGAILPVVTKFKEVTGNRILLGAADLAQEAGEAIREYYRVMEESMANADVHFPGHGIPMGGKVFTDEVLEEMRLQLDRAHKLAEDELVRQRLAKLELSYEYTCRLMKYGALRESIDSRQSGQLAVNFLEELVTEVRENRARWNGVVSPNVVRETSYLGKELSKLRMRVKRDYP